MSLVVNNHAISHNRKSRIRRPRIIILIKVVLVSSFIHSHFNIEIVSCIIFRNYVICCEIKIIRRTS